MERLRQFLAYTSSKGITGRQLASILLSEYKQRLIKKHPAIPPLSESSFSRIRHGDSIDSRHHGTIDELIERYLKTNKEYKDGLSLSENLQAIASRPEVMQILESWSQVARTKGKQFDPSTSILQGVWQVVNISTHNSDLRTKKFNQSIRSTLRFIHDDQGALRCLDLGVTTRWAGVLSKRGNFLHIIENETSSRSHGEGAYSIYSTPRPSAEREYNNFRFVVEGIVLCVMSGVWNDSSRPEHIYAGKSVMRKMPDLTRQYLGQMPKFLVDETALKKKYCKYVNIDENLEAIDANFEGNDKQHWADIIRMLRRPYRDGILDGGDYCIVE